LKRHASTSVLIHDVSTIEYLIEPDLFKGILRNVRIETISELTMGATIIDEWNLEKNCECNMDKQR